MCHSLCSHSISTSSSVSAAVYFIASLYKVYSMCSSLYLMPITWKNKCSWIFPSTLAISQNVLYFWIVEGNVAQTPEWSFFNCFCHYSFELLWIPTVFWRWVSFFIIRSLSQANVSQSSTSARNPNSYPSRCYKVVEGNFLHFRLMMLFMGTGMLLSCLIQDGIP